MSNFPKDISYFHGTGNVAHNFWTHKYHWKIEGIRNVLTTILNDWIKPFPDPLNADYSSTISLTSDPRYALLYSLLYSEKGTGKTYWVNRFREWAKVLSRILVVGKPISLKAYRVKWKRIVGNKELKNWTNSFNNEDYQRWVLSWFRGMIWWESNIEWNFPVVLGIKNLNSQFKEMPWWNEIRIHWWIPPENISAIFVPRDKMNALPATNIPIFPIEDFIQNYF